MSVDWTNILEKIIGGVLTAAIIWFIGWMTSRFIKSFKRIFDVVNSSVISVIRIGIRHWRLLLLAISFLSLSIIFYWLYADPIAVGLIAAYTALLIFLLTSWYKSIEKAFRQRENVGYFTISLDGIANSDIGNRYQQFSLGEKILGDTPFYIKAGQSIFDSSMVKKDKYAEIRYVELSLDYSKTEVKSIKSLHFLINSGGTWKRRKDNNQILIETEIGRLVLSFIDGTSQETRLVVGKNIREWAPGNFPGELINWVSDQTSEEVWRGKNAGGNEAVIDKLEILIENKNTEKELVDILIFPGVDKKSLADGITMPGFFVLAITLEYYLIDN